jgi:hypothetical protein
MGIEWRKRQDCRIVKDDDEWFVRGGLGERTGRRAGRSGRPG